MGRGESEWEGKGWKYGAKKRSEGKDVKAKGGMGSGREGWEGKGMDGKWKGG